MKITVDKCVVSQTPMSCTVCTSCGALVFFLLQRTEEREWLAQYYEESRSLPLSVERQKALLNHLIKSQTLDLFLAKKFINLKRYGAEGAESMMGFFQEVFSVASTGQSSATCRHSLVMSLSSASIIIMKTVKSCHCLQLE